MADVSVKMGVSGIAQFKQGMSDAAASVKTLDAALKTNEKQLQATGDKEAFLASQSNLLKGKLDALKTVVKNAEQALKQMEANGVEKTSKAYQDMQRRLVEAQGSILDTQQDMQNLGTAAGGAAGQTDKLATSLGGLNKRVSLEQVIGGINSITNAMEKAAGKAKDLGKKIWENITDTARWSDDIATQAMQNNMGVEEFQKWKGALETYAELTVQEWQKAKLKVQNMMYKATDEQWNIMSILGISPKKLEDTGGGILEPVEKDFEEMFWQLGQRLQQKVESGEISADLADVYANAIFGRGFNGLNTIFDMGKEEFQKKVDAQAAASEEAIQKNAELNDKLEDLQREFNAVKAEMISGLTPALSGAADAISKVLNSILEYLQKPEGQEMLDKLGETVAGLFEDLSKINPEDVVNNFVTVFNKLTEGLTFLKDNWEGIVKGIEAIGVAFGLLKVSEGVLTFMKLASGVKGFFGNGGNVDNGGKLTDLGGGGSGLGTKLLTGLSTLASKAGTALTAADPTGLTAMIVPALGDLTAGGRIIRDGGTVAEAAEAEKKAIEQAFDNSVKAWEDWGTQIIEVPKRLAKAVWKDLFGGGGGEGESGAGLQEEEIPVKIVPVAEYNAAQDISEQVGEVSVPVHLVVSGVGGSTSVGGNVGAGGGGGGGLADYYWDSLFGSFRPGFANGLPYVPFDGYPAILHRGERVLTARENRSYTFNNNTYFGGVNLHNGMEVDALTDSIAARNAKEAAAYGAG